MIKKILYGIMASLLILTYIIPIAAYAQDIEATPDNQIVTDTNTVLTYLGENSNSEHEYSATISSLPEYCYDLKTKINTTWSYNASTKLWKAGANLFTATIDGTNVIVTDKNNRRVYLDPKVKINGTEIKPVNKYPTLLSVDPINPNYTSNTMEWNYGAFKRHIRLIEGSILQYFIFENNPNGTVDIGTVQKDNGYTALRDNQAWDANNQPIKITNKTVVNRSEFDRDDIVYPITVDPTSSFTTSASDGCIQYYAPESYYEAITNSGNLKSGYEYSSYDGGATFYKSFVYFDTSSIPDASTITSANLYIYSNSRFYSSVDFNLIVQSGMPTYPHDPLVEADYGNYYSGSYGSINQSNFSGSAYRSTAINDTSIISKTGTTKLALRTDNEIAGNSDNAHEGWVQFYSYEQGTGYQPYITIVFSSVAPIISSKPASNEALTSASLNATLDNDGGESCEVRFGYGTTSQSAANFESYTTKTAWVAGKISEDNINLDIASLNSNTTYYYRVQAKNTHSTVTSTSEQSFTTLSGVADVTNFTPKPSSNSITLNWDSAIGASEYIIRYSASAYPTISTGTEIYNGTDRDYTHTGLTAGTNYYYSIWGKSGATYSTNATNLLVTTTASGTSNDGDLPPIVQPTGWFQSPNYVKLANVPLLYDMVNNVADGLDMPRATAWLAFAVFSSIGLAILAYAVSGQHLVAGLAILTLALAGWNRTEIISLWFPAVSLIVTLGTLVIRRQF